MVAMRQLCLSVLFVVFLFIIALVGGILIGIYAYHGGPNAEVTCKNIPQANENSQLNQATTIPSTRAPTTTNTTATTNRPTTTDGNCQSCIRIEPMTVWDGSDPEIFAPLTSQEMDQVYSFLVNNNLVSTGSLTLNSNYVNAMYLYLPEKAAVMNYKAGKGAYPGRYAHIHMVRGNRTVPDYMEYKVGPLNQAGKMTATTLYQDGELHFNSRPYDGVEFREYDKLLAQDFRILAPLTKESFDGSYYPDGNDDFQIWYPNGPPGPKAAERESRFLVYLNPSNNDYDSFESDFLPLTGSIHCPGNDVSTWYTYDFYYLNQGPFRNASVLMDAYNRNLIRKFALPKGYRDTVLDRNLPDRDTGAPFRRKSEIPPPRVYEPAGPRYTIKGYNVDWMGWNFDVTSGHLRGPGIYGVTFKGESIAYEIALNELAVVYGSGASAQTNIVYTDAMYGIGENYGLISSVDCPEHATLLNTSHWDYYEKQAVVYPSICVFEADDQNALWRHNGLGYEGGLRNTYLVVRYSTTIGNYDYIIEWHFLLDGKLITSGSASGHIQGAFWDKENPYMGPDKSRDAFGYHVSDNTHGQIHDHTFGFKVDLDIINTSNTMELIHWKAGDPLTALRSQVPTVNQTPPFFKYNETRYLQYEYVEREMGYRINIDQPKFWVVVNENTTNKWGARRGYQIKPLSTAIQTHTDAFPALPGLSFTKYHCAVTKRKETEQYLTSTSDSHRYDSPVQYVDKMLADNEYIRNTDIVHWVSTGFFHIPTAEDVPMTTRVTSGFYLKPFNFFDKTAVFDIQGYLNTEPSWRTERPPSAEPCLEPKYTP